jgi:hypothetical protein
VSEDWRPLTGDERAIIERLLEIPFPGRDEIRVQLDHCLVRLWEECVRHCGSLDFQVDCETLVPESGPFDTIIPVEARVTDEDDIPIDVIMFTKDGRLSSLEFVVYSDRMKRRPRAEDLDVWRRPDR